MGKHTINNFLCFYSKFLNCVHNFQNETTCIKQGENSKAVDSKWKIWDDSEVPTLDTLPDDASLDPRLVPEYDISYQQAVTSEDIYLQMGGKGFQVVAYIVDVTLHSLVFKPAARINLTQSGLGWKTNIPWSESSMVSWSPIQRLYTLDVS